MLRKNKIYDYQVDLWHTGIKLGKNWKLRVKISSSDFHQSSYLGDYDRVNEDDDNPEESEAKLRFYEEFKTG
jgi:hypothetical protein